MVVNHCGAGAVYHPVFGLKGRGGVNMVDDVDHVFLGGVCGVERLLWGSTPPLPLGSKTA